jgi:hypothetical protein
MGNYPVIDVDGHVFEQESMWQQYLESTYQERRPRIVLDNKGAERYLIEGRLWPTPEGRGAWVPEGIIKSGCRRPGGYDPQARLKDMDMDGIDMAVLYGTTALGFCWIEDAKFGAALCRAYNNWLADYCKADPKRLKGVASLPLQDMEAMLQEAHRAVKDLGMVTLQIQTNAMGKNPDHPSYYPLYELAQDLDVSIGFHFGGGGAGVDRFVNNYVLAHACGFAFDTMLAMSTVLCGGVLEKFPRLRVAFLEAACGWAPYWIDRLDEHYEKRTAEMPNIKKKPSEYLQNGNCFITCDPDEDEVAHVVEVLGDDKIMFASDYPHWDAMFPGSVAAISERDTLSEQAKRRILGENAQRYLHLH